MGKTSRREFAKSVAGAIAAIPIASLTSGLGAKGQSKKRTTKRRTAKKQATRKVILDCYRSHENTPPPIELIDGSLNLKVKHKDAASPLAEVGAAQTWYYRGNVNETYPNRFEHIKVFHGSGGRLYQDFEAAGSVITIQVKDEADDLVGTLELTTLELSGGKTELQIKSVGYGNGNGNGKLTHSMASGKPKKKHSWQHRGGDGSKDFRITGIKITGGSEQPIDLELPPISSACPFESQEFRVLIWLADEP